MRCARPVLLSGAVCILHCGAQPVILGNRFLQYPNCKSSHRRVRRVFSLSASLAIAMPLCRCQDIARRSVNQCWLGNVFGLLTSWRVLRALLFLWRSRVVVKKRHRSCPFFLLVCLLNACAPLKAACTLSVVAQPMFVCTHFSSPSPEPAGRDAIYHCRLYLTVRRRVQSVYCLCV